MGLGPSHPELPNKQQCFILFPTAGCRAADNVFFTLELVNCQNLAVVKATVNFLNEGTECGKVDQTTADYICSSSLFGQALDHGRAIDN